MSRLVALGMVLLLGGCMSTAVYRHPVTQDVKRCEQEIGLFWWSGPLAYGACKDALEAQGYERRKGEVRATD